jgi:Type II secretion system (T2SS), protein M subtype b
MNFNFNNRQHLLGLFAGAVIGLFLGDKLVFTPLVKSWSARSERLTQLKKDVRQGEALLERSAAIQSRWDNMRTNTLALEPSVAESQVQRAKERWLQASGVTINSFRTQWKRSADDFMTIECRVDVAGSLGTLARFLYEIEHDPLGVKVDRADLSSRDTEGQQLNLALQISGLQLLKPGA